MTSKQTDAPQALTTSELGAALYAAHRRVPVPGFAAAVAVADRSPTIVSGGTADVRTGGSVAHGTRFHACSIAKLVTAVGVLRLVDLGRVDLDAPVEAHLGGRSVRDLATGLPVPVSLGDLLAHRSGIADPGLVFEPTAGPQPSLQELLADRGPRDLLVLRRPPGTFEYSDAGYCVIEHVVEVVTGTGFAEAMWELVFDPLGLTGTAFWNGDEPAPSPLADDTLVACGHDRSGTPIAGGRQHYPGLAASGLWTTAGDLAALLQDLARTWARERDGALLTWRAARQMIESQRTPGVGLGVFTSRERTGLTVMTQGWGQGFQSQALVDVEQERVRVALINADPGTEQSASLTGHLLTTMA